MMEDNVPGFIGYHITRDVTILLEMENCIQDG